MRPDSGSAPFEGKVHMSIRRSDDARPRTFVTRAESTPRSHRDALIEIPATDSEASEGIDDPSTHPRLMTRRSIIASGASALLGAAAVSCAATPTAMQAPGGRAVATGAGETIRGSLSGRPVFIPDVNAPPMPTFAQTGPLLDGETASMFDVAALSAGHPDACSSRRRFGLLIPATNTVMESELWTILVRNREHGLDGIGLHTSVVSTPKPDVSSPQGVEQFKRDFVAGVSQAVGIASLARPQYFILGMSLEHIISGIEPIRATTEAFRNTSELSWATWTDAAKAALDRYGARRIALITPFERTGTTSAARMFTDLGFEVVSTFGFACAHAQHVAHIPDVEKERVVTELLATKEHRLDAVVQCGTNMSMVAVAERLEPKIGIPILSINATLLWYALRETGIAANAHHAGRLLREF